MSYEEIRQLNHQYAAAVGRRDETAWAATWDDNAKWELGKGRTVDGKEAIVKLWNSAMDGFNAVVQNVVDGMCELDEEAGTGTGRQAIMENWQRANGDVGILLAYYDDSYVRTDGKWLFASRELVVHYSGPPDLSGTFLNAWGEASDG